MSVRRFICSVIVLGALTALGGCANMPPYVYNPAEFDRESADFGRDPTDIEEVTICYSRRATTMETVEAMAQGECARFQKVARFEDDSFLYCPLLTPTSARFECVRP